MATGFDRNQVNPYTIASFAEEIPTGIWVARVPDGEPLYSNRAFREMTGSEPSCGDAKSPRNLYDPAGLPYSHERLPFVRAMAERRTVSVDDLVVQRPDGRRVYVRATAKPLFDDEGAMQQVVVTYFDITSARQREAETDGARQQAERRLQTVVNNAPITCWAFDVNAVVTLSEGRALSELGLRPGQLVGRCLFDLYPADAPICEAVRRVLAGEGNVTVVGDGPAYFETRLEPVRDTAGRVIGGVGVSTDISQQRRMETQLMHADRLISMGRLAASVAHEVNGPLQYLLTSLSVLSDRLSSGCPESAELVSDAQEGAERIRCIANDLRTYARPELEHIGAVGLRDVMHSALRMSSCVTTHRARLVEQYEACPAVGGNEARLGQVFLNLILNAAHAVGEREAAGQEIRVSTRTDASGWAVVEVQDTGPGIAPELLPRIFQPFFTTKPIGVGSGLGLSVSKSIVESLGGEIQVESEVGRGSTFRVRLPPWKRQVATHAATQRQLKTNGCSARRARILIIDDDLNLGRVLASNLSSHETVVATSGQEGLKKLLGPERFDLVLCDLMMRDMTGMDIHDALKVQRPGLEKELVLMTGGAFTARTHKFLSELPNRCIEKPFNVLKMVDSLLSERAQ